jgi:hypothetical protein
MKVNTKRFFISLVRNKGDCPIYGDSCCDIGSVYNFYRGRKGYEGYSKDTGCFCSDAYSFSIQYLEKKYPVDYLEITLEKL